MEFKNIASFKDDSLEILYCNEIDIIKHIAESFVISELPMSTKQYTREDLVIEIEGLYNLLRNGELDKYQRSKTVKLLGNAKVGSGHNCFLKGITLNAVIKAPSYWYPQMQRYHFIDIISSQSKMHKITNMDLKAQCTNNVDQSIIDLLNDLIDSYNHADEKYKEDAFRNILANCPMGLTLTCGVFTNYLQLLSMYNQRKNHRLQEWSKSFCGWIESLPYFKELCLGGNND